MSGDPTVQRIDARQQRIEDLLVGVLLTLQDLHATITTQGETMAADLTRLTAEVAETSDVQQSAITLLTNIAEQLRQTGSDQAAIDALADQLDSSAAALASAIVENTPADPDPEPPVDPPFNT